MKPSTLAARLIGAKGERQRKALLTANVASADIRLARALKDECYRVWTSDPAAARQVAAALSTLSSFVRSSPEIDAMQAWVAGIADITRGKLESAVTHLDRAVELLSRLGHEHESAQPQVAKLIALAMLGRYDEAQRTGENALRIFEKYRDGLAAGKIEMNLSNLVSRRDQYRLAEKYCLSAYKRFAKLGETSWQTMAENGLANTYAELNEFERAEKFYSRALDRARRTRMNLTVAEIEASMGNLALFRGRYADALRRLELSRQKYEKLGMPHQSTIAELEIADIYAELNLNEEASEIYTRLIPTLRRLKMRAEEARARSNFGRVLTAADAVKDARKMLKAAASLFLAEKNFVAAAGADLRRASIERTLGNYQAAIKLVDSAIGAIDSSENVRLMLTARWLRGEVLAAMGRVDDAATLLDATIRNASRAEQHAIAQAAMNSLGLLAFEHGDLRQAEELFSSAIASVEAARAPLPGEEFRMAFLAKTLEPYKNLTRLYVREGRIEDAFVCVERSRARALLEGISARRSTSRGGNTKLREELNWHYSRLDRASDEEEIAKIQREIRQRERALAAAALRAESTVSRRRKGDAGAVIDVVKLQRRLGRDRALVEFVISDGAFSAFVVSSDRISFYPGIATEAEILSLLDGLHFQFGSLRFGGEAVRQFAPQLKSRADSYLDGLYLKLLAPFEREISGRDLVIVPAGATNYVPFHALRDAGRYVVESCEVVCSPSAAVWLHLNSRSRRRGPSNAMLMSFADEKIPFADREVDVLSKRLPEASKFTGRRATFAAFESNAPKYDLLHLACHGQFRPDNPMFSSLHLADGWVTVRDVCSRDLRAELVTLSACETGLSRVFAGEEILGLARGFLSAGAKSLVLSLWTVNDEATTRLMIDFYSSLQRGMGAPASLRIAQCSFIDRGEHPYFWSPFFAIA